MKGLTATRLVELTEHDLNHTLLQSNLKSLTQIPLKIQIFPAMREEAVLWEENTITMHEVAQEVQLDTMTTMEITLSQLTEEVRGNKTSPLKLQESMAAGECKKRNKKIQELQKWKKKERENGFFKCMKMREMIRMEMEMGPMIRTMKIVSSAPLVEESSSKRHSLAIKRFARKFSSKKERFSTSKRSGKRASYKKQGRMEE